MKQFILRLSLFLFPIVCISLAMEIMLRNMPNDFKVKQANFEKKMSLIEILVLGSSHSFYDINPSYLRRQSFNMAEISQSYDYDLMLLEKYQHKLKKLKFIILPVSYFSLFEILSKGSEDWRVKNYTLYYGLTSNASMTSYSELLSSKLRLNLQRIRKYYFKGIDPVITSENGYGINFLSKEQQDLEETGRTAAIRHTIKSKELLNNNIHIVEVIVRLAKKMNATIIFITTPAYYSYRQNLDTSQLNQTLRIIKTITSKNSTNSLYLNFLNSSYFTKEDYFDADHLNEIGAQKFTKRLDSIINNISSGKAIDSTKLFSSI